MSRPAPLLPVYRVAVVKSESESMHFPARDVTKMLGDRTRWRYRLFTAHTFDGLLRTQREFDCVVVGYNALYRNPSIMEAINASRLRIGVVLLHQAQEERCQLQLADDLTLSWRELRPSDERAAAVAHQRNPHLEILLNWPEVVDVTHLQTGATRWLQPEHDSPWRAVLEIGANHTVLMRSSLARWPPVVACSLTLEPGRDQDSRLLRNLIAFAAAGPPATVVVGSQRSYRARSLVSKLRLRRVNALELPDTDHLDFERWPLRAVSDVVRLGDGPAIPNERRWLERGGRLTTVNARSGELCIRYRASDLQWVARRWSAWLQTMQAEECHQSIMAARAHLRALKTLEDTLGEDLGRFGIAHASSRGDALRMLASKRLKGSDNLEGSIGTTAALVEIDALTGGILPDHERERVRRWLKDKSEDAIAEDLVEIGRVLADFELIERGQAKVERPLSISALTRLRLGAVACGKPLRDLVLTQKDHDSILEEATSSLLGAAEYLSSMAIYSSYVKQDRRAHHQLSNDEHLLIDAAIATLTKGGMLAAEESSSSLSAQEVCAEAQALATYLMTDSAATSGLVKAEAVPPQLIDTILVEGLQLRGDYRELQESAERAQRSLAKAKHMLGAIAVALALGAGWLTHTAISGVLGDTVAPLAAAALAMLLLGFGLAWLEICPAWLVKVVQATSGGLRGVMDLGSSVLERAVNRGADQPAQEQQPPAAHS